MRAFAPVAVFALAAFIACGGSEDATSSATANPNAKAVDETTDADGGIIASGSDGGIAPTKDAATTTDASKVDGSKPMPMPMPTSMPTNVFTVVFENHDYLEVVGSSDAPYFNSLIAKYGLATNYHDSGVHPSLPNYLTMISGAPQYAGIVDLSPKVPPFPASETNLGSQLQAAGISWRSYQESMGIACNLSSKSPYAPKHDPFLYFDDMQNGASDLCKKTNIDYTFFPGELAAGTVRYSFITPNLVNDGHDGNAVTAMQTCDAWAAVEIEKIIASPAYQNGGVIFITWDEAAGRGGHSGSQVPMIVVSESLKSAGYKSAVKYSHKSYLATVEDILGLARLATVKTEPSMLEFFK